MKRWPGLLGLCLAGLMLLSCSSGQQLQSITVTPQSATFLDPDATVTVQLTATGSYTHPPATKNLTDQVTWSVDVNKLIIVSKTGLVSVAGTGTCGVANVTASLQTNNPTGNVVSNFMTVTVADSADPDCPQP
ncbi:MAG: hypothetical protein WBM11_06040 [Terriglobales bacterium]